MHEIVIVRCAYYEAGAEVYGESLIVKSQERKRWWWFDGPYTEKDLGLVLKPHPTKSLAVMSCEAIWFEFDFVPSLRDLDHFQPGSSYMRDEFDAMGFEIFEESLPELVEIVRRKIKAADCPAVYADTDFYALYDVELDEHRDEDGGLDSIDVMPTLLGELDISKINLAVIEPQKNGEAGE
jgi:hypothetical protein